MRKIISGLSAILISCMGAVAGDYGWVKVLPDAQGSTFNGIFTDNSGTVYLYGTRSGTGTFLKAYNSRGQEIFSKDWPGNLTLTRIIYSSKNNALFFSGTYDNSVNSLDGQPLKHYGKTDACIGRISKEGAVTWVHGFGGPEDDNAKAIAYDDKNERVLLTGTCEGRVNSVTGHMATCSRAVFVSAFSTRGNQLSFKTFDFSDSCPSPGGENAGHSIAADKRGNAYLLASRVGRPWSDPNTQYPEFGEYVMKLNKDFDIQWSTFVISQACYYGYEFGSLEVTEDGFAHVRKRCDAKYGGNGSIQRIEPDSGKTVWVHGVQEATYRDLCYAGNGLFATGNESAYECPCPNGHPGYNVFKRISSTGQTVFEEQSSAAKFLKITADNSGSAYVLGTFSDSVKLGNFGIEGPQNSYFLLRYEDSAMIPGVKERALASVNVYPNPGNEKLIIEAPDKIIKAELFDYAGNVVLQTNEANRKRIEYNISQLPEGVYIYRINMIGRRYKSGKVVVTRE